MVSLELPSFGSLPYELLHEIVSYSRGQERIPKRFRVVYALSKVNKWLRCFALSILFRDINIAHWKLHLLLDYFSTQGACYAQHVRSIRFRPSTCTLGHGSGPFVPYFLLGTSTEDSVFPNLRSLDCPPGSGRRGPVVIDLAHRDLHHLSISYPAEQAFPPLERFTQLKSLRLVLVPELHCYFEPQLCKSFDTAFSSHPYPLLTALSVRQQDFHMCVARWPASAWRALSFPNLRALSLEYLTGVSPNQIYDFVQRHSTLMEVHIEFPDAKLRVEGVIKLIQGTGTWASVATQPADDVLQEHPAIVDTVDRTEYDYLDGVRVPTADDIPEIYICAQSFGFVRESITPGATEWRSSWGSNEARYRAISLAFSAPLFEDNDENDDTFASSADAFFGLSAYFPGLRELRLECQNAVIEKADFTSCMADFASQLALWKNLEKLSMCFLFDEEWEWRSVNNFPGVVEHFEGKTPFLNVVAPPIEIMEYKPHTINMLRRYCPDEVIDPLKERVRTILPYDEPIDLDDPFLITRCWEYLNHNKVSKVFSSLVDRCPTLKEIEWYPSIPSNYCESQTESGSMWKYEVHKGRSAVGRRVTTCRFACFDSPQGDFPSLLVLVGEELAREREIRLRRLWRC